MISICTANFNKWPYLVDFLNSIKKYESEYVSEIVIVDDFSTDDSCEIIKKRSKENSTIHIKLIENTINKWPWPSYDISVRNASNEFIMIMDSDDFIIASSLAQKIDYFKNNSNCRIVYGNGKIYDDKNNVFMTDSLNDSFFTTTFSGPLSAIKRYFETSVSNLYVPWCLICKKFLIDDVWWFDHTLKSNDRVLNIKIFSTINTKEQIWYCDIPCFAYRIWDSNISRRYSEMKKLMVDVARKYWSHDNKKTLLSNIYFTIAMNALRNGDKQVSFWYFKKSFKHGSTTRKTASYIIAFLVPSWVIKSSLVRRYAQKIYLIVTS